MLLNNRWCNHRHFGRMRLGSIADCLAAPADADGSHSLRNAVSPAAERRPDRFQPVARRLAQGPAHARGSSPGRPISTSPRRKRLTAVVAVGRRGAGRHALDPRRRRRPHQFVNHEHDPGYRRRGLHRLPPGPQAALAAGHEVVGVDNLNDYYSVQLKQDRLAQLLPESRFRSNASTWRTAPPRRGCSRPERFDAVGAPGRPARRALLARAIRSPTSRATWSGWPTCWRAAGMAGSSTSCSPRRVPSTAPTRRCRFPSIRTSTIP